MQTNIPVLMNVLWSYEHRFCSSYYTILNGSNPKILNTSLALLRDESGGLLENGRGGFPREEQTLWDVCALTIVHKYIAISLSKTKQKQQKEAMDLKERV